MESSIREKPDTPNRRQNPRAAAQEGEHEAFCQQLPDHSPPSRPDAEPDRHFSPPRRRTREQQVRDVGARDGQNQSHHGQQDVERLGIGSAKVCPDRRRHPATGIAGGSFVPDPWLPWRQPRHRKTDASPACACAMRDSGPQPAHHLRPVVVFVLIAADRRRILFGSSSRSA